MTSDIKLSHYFLSIKLINRDVFLTLKSFRKYSVNAAKLLRLSTFHCKMFLFLFLFLCGYRVLQPLCHNVEGTHDIKFSQK